MTNFKTGMLSRFQKEPSPAARLILLVIAGASAIVIGWATVGTMTAVIGADLEEQP